MSFQAAKCPNCGGDLQVPDERTTVKCMYCGGDVVVREAIHTASVGNVANWMKLAQVAAQSGNAEEAINYFNKVLEIDSTNYEAWYFKGESVSGLSTLKNCRLSEMLSCIQKGIEYAPANLKPQIQRRAAFSITTAATGYFNWATNHLNEFVAVDGVWFEYLTNCSQVLSALDEAHNYSPSEKTILEWIILICKRNIEGVVYFGTDFHGNPARLVTRISDQYSQTLKSKMDKCIWKMRHLDPTFQAPQIQKAKSGCFVATATMGHSNHPMVLTLRDLRDIWLEKTAAGRLFVRAYYAYGPLLAELIRRSETLRKISFHLIVRPSACLAKLIISRNRS